MYVGWVVVVILIAGCLVARGARESPLKWTGLLCFVLGLGAFDPHAPWTLLHKLPVFSTQHVPSRWMYPGLLLLIAVAGAAFDRVMRRTGWARAWLEIAALAGVAWIARDVGKIAREPIRRIFYEPMPHVADSTGPFHTEEHMPANLGAQMDWSPPSLQAVMANIGTIDCGTFPPFHNYWRHPGPNGIPAPGMGARTHAGQGLPGRGIRRGRHRQRDHRQVDAQRDDRAGSRGEASASTFSSTDETGTRAGVPTGPVRSTGPTCRPPRFTSPTRPSSSASGRERGGCRSASSGSRSPGPCGCGVASDASLVRKRLQRSSHTSRAASSASRGKCKDRLAQTYATPRFRR